MHMVRSRLLIGYDWRGEREEWGKVKGDIRGKWQRKGGKNCFEVEEV